MNFLPVAYDLVAHSTYLFHIRFELSELSLQFRRVALNMKGTYEINKSNRVRTTDAFWRPASILVSKSSFKWRTFNSRCYFVRIQSISQKFNSCVTDRRTDGRTYTPSYRDARTHLKTVLIVYDSSSPQFTFRPHGLYTKKKPGVLLDSTRIPSWVSPSWLIRIFLKSKYCYTIFLLIPSRSLSVFHRC